MIQKPIVWIVVETYENNDFRNAPDKWTILEVFEQDQKGSHLFFRDGEVVIMPTGLNPEDHYDQIRFELAIDDEPDGDERSTFTACSTRIRAKDFIAAQKQKRSAA